MLNTRLASALVLAMTLTAGGCASFGWMGSEDSSDAAEVARSAQAEDQEGQDAMRQRLPVVPVQASDSYYMSAHQAIADKIAARKPGRAKNVILFIGDGMGVSTITATRIFAGQSKGVDGVSYKLAMDTLPWSALSKTYSHNSQVADSAPTATAMTTGVKAPERTIGVTQQARFDDCATQADAATDSLFAIAEDVGLSTGVVTTTRITHATPAAVYARSVNRDWESDVEAQGGCPDIARQLVEWPHGDGLDVILGGGRAAFMTQAEQDPEYADKTGSRADGRDLIAEWLSRPGRRYVMDKAELDALDLAKGNQVMGLFEPSHMQYELDRAGDRAGEPSLADLTETAIKRLSQDKDGYVLMVEGGRIDHAHHAGNAARALADALAFDEAVARAKDMTDEADTLIIVTADHSHTLSISGYAERGNPILGLSQSEGELALGEDGKPYTTLGYMNGPGAICPGSDSVDDLLEGGARDKVCSRKPLTDDEALGRDFRQQSAVPLKSETHGGEDVAILARGPGAELFSGVMEENEIFHVMAASLGLVK